MKTLVVAQSPHHDRVPGNRALEGSSSLARLAKLGGVRPDDVYASVDVVNLLEEKPGPVWDLVAARTRALELMFEPENLGRQRVVLLGRRVLDAFAHWNEDISRLSYFAWARSSGAWWSYSPHPSGQCRAWNSEEVREAGRQFWSTVLQ